MRAVRQWVVSFSSSNSDSVSPLLVQIFMSTACRLLFTAAKNAELMVAIMLEKRSAPENLLYQIVLLCSSYLL